MKIQVQISWKGQSTRLGRASLSFSSGLYDIICLKQIVGLLNYRGLFIFSIDLFHGNHGRTQRSNLLINKVPVSLLEKGKKFYQIFPARPPQLCQKNIYVNRLKAAGAEEKRVFVLISQLRLEQVKLVNKKRPRLLILTDATISMDKVQFLRLIRLVFEGVNKKGLTAVAHSAFPNLLIDRERNEHVPSVCEVPFLALESHYRVWKIKIY